MRGTGTETYNQSASTSIPRPAGGTPAKEQDTQGNDTKQSSRRLTLADHPLAVDSTPGTNMGALKATTGELGWSKSLMTGRCSCENSTRPTEAIRAAKSVLVLNGAACFIAGKLASTGEPRVSDRVEQEVVKLGQ